MGSLYAKLFTVDSSGKVEEMVLRMVDKRDYFSYLKKKKTWNNYNNTIITNLAFGTWVFFIQFFVVHYIFTIIKLKINTITYIRLRKLGYV